MLGHMAYRKRPAGTTNRSGGRSTPSNVLASQEPADVLAREKALRIDQLWTACDAYEKRFYSGGIHAQILELKLAGSQKAVQCQHWILGLWRSYYARKDAIEAAQNTGVVQSVSLDFTTHGSPPYSVRVLLQDAPIV